MAAHGLQLHGSNNQTYTSTHKSKAEDVVLTTLMSETKIEKKETLRILLLTSALVARHQLARSASSESYGTYSTLIPERDSSGSARLALVTPSHWMSGADSV